MHGDRVKAEFRGELWTQRQSDATDPEEIAVAEKYGLKWVSGLSAPGLGKDKLHYGGNSGYQAINLAYLWGAKTIVLLGYDMHRGKEAHFFGDHPKELDAGTDYTIFLQHFPQLAEDLKAEGVTVWNATRQTALKAFPCISIEFIRSSST